MEKYKAGGKALKINPLYPATGTIIVNVNNLNDVFRTRKKFSWLRQFEPSYFVGKSWLVFELSVDKILAKKTLLSDYALAWIYFLENKNLPAARYYVNRLLAITGGDRTFSAETLYLSGLIYYESGNMERAKLEFLESLKYHKYMHESLKALARLYFEAGDINKSAIYRRVSVHAKIIDSYAVPPPLAPAEYLARLAANQKDTVALNNLGYLYWTQGNLEDAIKFISKAAELSHNHADFFGNLACLYYEAGNSEKALENLRRYYYLLPRTESYVVQQVSYGTERIILGKYLVIPPEELFEKQELEKYTGKIFGRQ